VTDPVPVFTLLAKDQLAVDTVAYYQQQCRTHGLTGQAAQVGLALDEFAAWRQRHPDLVKVPDHRHQAVTDGVNGWRSLVVASRLGMLPGLYTAPVVQDAALLLRDLAVVCRRHHVDPAWEGDLAQHCLNMLTHRVEQSRPDVGERRRLVTVFAARMAELGQPCVGVPDGLEVLLPHWAGATPTPHQLVLAADPGWQLVGRLSSSQVATRRVVGGYDDAGARAVADLVADVNAGRRGNPFHTRVQHLDPPESL
jgi:hypothetical protein